MIRGIEGAPIIYVMNMEFQELRSPGIWEFVLQLLLRRFRIGRLKIIRTHFQLRPFRHPFRHWIANTSGSQ